MLVKVLVCGFIGWVCGYMIVYNNITKAISDAGEWEGLAGVIAINMIPTAPDTILFMTIGVAVGLLWGALSKS